MAMATVVTTLTQPLACAMPLSARALTNAAAPSATLKTPLRSCQKFSAFLNGSFGSRFAFRGHLTKRVAENRTQRRKLVVQAKRMTSSENVVTRAPDFEVMCD